MAAAAASDADLGVKNERRDICFWREDGLVLEWPAFFTPPPGLEGVLPDIVGVCAGEREGDVRVFRRECVKRPMLYAFTPPQVEIKYQKRTVSNTALTKTG